MNDFPYLLDYRFLRNFWGFGNKFSIVFTELNRKERLLFPSLPGTNRATFTAVRSRISQPLRAALKEKMGVWSESMVSVFWCDLFLQGNNSYQGRDLHQVSTGDAGGFGNLRIGEVLSLWSERPIFWDLQESNTCWISIYDLYLDVAFFPIARWSPIYNDQVF